jgi:hypothetical protein
LARESHHILRDAALKDTTEYGGAAAGRMRVGSMHEPPPQRARLDSVVPSDSQCARSAPRELSQTNSFGYAVPPAPMPPQQSPRYPTLLQEYEAIGARTAHGGGGYAGGAGDELEEPRPSAWSVVDIAPLFVEDASTAAAAHEWRSASDRPYVRMPIESPRSTSLYCGQAGKSDSATSDATGSRQSRIPGPPQNLARHTSARAQAAIRSAAASEDRVQRLVEERLGRARSSRKGAK